MQTHPSLEYGLVFTVAAAGTYLLTPVARSTAVWWGAVALPRARDVHTVPMPRMGGPAIFLGFAIAVVIASALPTLQFGFGLGPDFTWILIAGAIICGVGVIDDRYELDSLTKLAGQVAAAGVMVTKGGVQLALIYVPWGHAGTVSVGPDIGIPVTILMTVVTVNAINFIDGLDGLAAGVAAISAIAFFIFSYHLAQLGYTDVAAAPTLVCAALAGACIGFLPHNFSPARIFMGDSGSMLIGLMLAAAATTATTSIDPQELGRGESLALFLPFLLPIAVLALPFVDLLLAVVRRLRRGQSPFAPDKEHLHHRLLEVGHTHRRAVLLLYFWSALLAGSGVMFAVIHRPWIILMALGGLVVVGLLASVVRPLRPTRR
jgi:UDP-GlcNAc:undecaprenyl-phosphate/decaprenyl-phosphate GlcNAc-1-phosphate transferase